MARQYRGMSVDELVKYDGLSRFDAEQEINNRVFGVGHAIDPKTGRPIEQGIGSPQRQTLQHKEALERERQRQAMIDAAVERVARK